MNWQRSILKDNAKISLHNCYWVSFAVSLVATLLSGGIFSIYSSFQHLVKKLHDFQDGLFLRNEWSGADFSWHHSFGFFPTISSILALLTLLVAIFIGAAMMVGASRYYLRKRFGDTHFSTLFSGFQQSWGNTVGVLFTTNLFIFLWSLLFIVPGIVKRYQYYYVDFLLADNPSLTGKRAREISWMLSDGEKGRLFLFDLSFFWWYILVGLTSLITLGLSVSFLMPYVESARAELYIYVRDRAIQMNQLNPAELCLQPANSQPQ
jgi:uncharacterized membrane protein